MKHLPTINITGISITLLLYLTFWGGILAQIGLGILQVFCYLLICLQFFKLNKSLKIHMIVYGFLTASILLLTYIYSGNFIIFLWWFSGILAFYFLYITFLFEKQLNHETRHS